MNDELDVHRQPFRPRWASFSSIGWMSTRSLVAGILIYSYLAPAILSASFEEPESCPA